MVFQVIVFRYILGKQAKKLMIWRMFEFMQKIIALDSVERSRLGWGWSLG
jgi:hypothetical protein